MDVGTDVVEGLAVSVTVMIFVEVEVDVGVGRVGVPVTVTMTVMIEVMNVGSEEGLGGGGLDVEGTAGTVTKTLWKINEELLQVYTDWIL